MRQSLCWICLCLTHGAGVDIVKHSEGSDPAAVVFDALTAAKARGVKFGRPRKALPEGFGEVKARWERGELSARAAGKLLGVTHRSFLLWAQDDGCKEIVKKTQKVKRAG